MSTEDPSPPPPIHSPKSAPPVAPPQGTGPVQPTGTVLDTMIPSRNGNALVSYYLGLFSIFPFFGLFMGAIAVAKGRRALAALKADPTVAGGTHAKVGIGCGAIGFLFNLTLVVIVLAAVLYH